MPEAEAAAIAKNLTAVGAVSAAAGIATGATIVLVRVGDCIQFTPALPPRVQAPLVPVTVKAVTGKV